MSAYTIGAAARAARREPPAAAAEPGPIARPARGPDDRTGHADLPMFAEAEHLDALRRRETRSRRTPAEAVAGLDQAIADAIAETRIPRPSPEVLLHTPTGGPYPGQASWDPATWAREARRTGVFFPLPHGTVILRRHIEHNAHAADAFIDELARAYEVMNDHFRRAAENGASDQELAALARALATPRGTFSASGDENDFSEERFRTALADPQKVFGLVHFQLMRNEEAEIVNGIDSFTANGPAMGALLGQAGIDLLLEEARSLELELFADPEQFKVDVNLAIMEHVEDLGGDMMGWSELERAAFDAYVEVAREEAIAAREAELEAGERRDQEGEG